MPTVPYNNELPKKYNPQNTSREVLKNTFSIRLREYEKIWGDIREATMATPEQHYIIQGVRGAGKTTLLTRLLIAIEEDTALSQWLIPVQFKEEEYGISNLFNLWVRIAEDLEEHHQYANLFHGLSQDIETIDSDESTEAEAAFKHINAKLTQHQKKIILLIDNIAELFDHFTESEKALLREILTQNVNIRIVGGSAISLESFYDHKDPFYQFFTVITLKNLNKTDTKKFLTTLGQAAGEEEHKKIKHALKQDPQKIESIRRLTGGIPRTMALLFDILIEGPQGDTFKYLDHTLDMASPIYKHRMDDLSSQQKPIIHTIAKHWDAISAKEIAEKTRINSKTVSAQLAQLQKQWIIEKVPTGTKNHLYRLQERFFNIWYLMRYGRRRDKNKMRWLTQFLEIWCSHEEMRDRSQQFRHNLHNSTYLPGAVAYTSALLGCQHIGIQEKEAVYHQAHTVLSEKGQHDLLKQLPEITSDEYYSAGLAAYHEDDFEQAIDCLTKSLNKGETRAALGIGYIYSEKLSDYEKAEKAYLTAIEHEDYHAYMHLGYMYCNNLQDFDRAESAYLKAGEYEYFDAYLNLGHMYCEKHQDFDRAKIAYLKAIEHEDYRVYLNLGHMYCHNLQDFDQAENAYLNAIEHEIYEAYVNLGNLYRNDLQAFDQAEKAYLNAIRHGDHGAYLNLGNMYRNDHQKFDQAEKAYLKAIEHEDYKVYVNLGNMYRDDLQAFAQAEKAYLNAIEHGLYGAYTNLGNMYRHDLQELDKAEEAYLKAIGYSYHEAYLSLGNMYWENLQAIDKAEEAYLKAVEHKIYGAYLNLGNMYCENLQAFDKAENAYLAAIKHEEYGAYLNLGNMHLNNLKDTKKAESVYLEGIAYTPAECLNALAWMYFESKNITKQEDALTYAQQAVEHDASFAILHTLACVALWNQNIKLAKETTNKIFLTTDSWKENDQEKNELIDVLLLFLAKQQTNLVDQWFTQFDLKDYFTPLYYALMHLMKETYPHEYLRMGAELEETVQEILATIDTLEC